MSYLALYRRYRPTDFNHLIGQEHIVKTLTNQIESNRLGHAYLFTGTRGTGKTSCAKIFAKAINCLHPVNGSPCGSCESCMALADASSMDIIEIDAASNNGVNEIRELRENVQYPPVACKYKVYIIDEVHMLSGAAFNALLKTLEEPPKHAVFILATTEAHKIPATILSRCMRFDFKLIPTEQIAKLICDIYDEVGKKYEKEAVFQIARAGDGSIRDALSIADIALSFNDGTLTYADVNEILGSSNFDLIFEFAKNMLTSDVKGVLNNIDTLCSLGKSMGVLTKDITETLRDVLVVKTCGKEANNILGYPEQKFNMLNSLAEIANANRILRAMEIFSKTETSLKFTTHPRIVFESSAIKASKPDSDFDLDSIVARISELEEKIKKGNFSGGANSVKTPEKEKPVLEESEKKQIGSVDSSTIKGVVLRALRKANSEMLWNVMQSVEIENSGNVLTLYSDSESDRVYLSTQNVKESFNEALNEFLPFSIVVKEPLKSKEADKINQATDKIKELFGKDIVIIKH